MDFLLLDTYLLLDPSATQCVIPSRWYQDLALLRACESSLPSSEGKLAQTWQHERRGLSQVLGDPPRQHSSRLRSQS
jgi:hypothetical protein